MVSGWTTWKLFPLAERGEHLQAPIGPGVYEVRQVSTGGLIAFGHSGQVAHALSRLAPSGPVPFWKRAFAGTAARTPRRDLEYRTCATATKEKARMVAEQLIGRRQVYWRRGLSGSPA
jgi:hypothetical protein